MSACCSFFVGLFRMLYDKWKVVNWIERPHTSILQRMDEVTTLAAKERCYQRQGNGSKKGKLGSERDTKKERPMQQKDKGSNMDNIEPSELTPDVGVEHGSAGPSTLTDSMLPTSAMLPLTTTSSIDRDDSGEGENSGLSRTRDTGQLPPRGGAGKKFQAKDEWRRAGDRFYGFLESGMKRAKGWLWKRE
ncbi:hypothetical protein AYL99_01508 [Fonsecaea erecta]|uniref:Uncharacterized protein n=1 Tax=Fonsecaea erecta TaxID=1367422 RepID=A0A179A1Z3_9EURO|nr:hypothetical protein AYL99_01508 [Fonsecaea erecta]OAP65536.1 hypothetical protein AYL99_01508 [Fonsecaea erecta]